VGAQGKRCEFLADDVSDDFIHRLKVGRCWLEDAAVVAQTYSTVSEIV